VSEVRISAEPRTEFGKGFARRTRRDGRVPAVLYGHGTDPRHVSLPARELMHAFKGGANVLLEIEMPDGRELALPRQVQRDPLRGDLTHVDLLLVRRGEKVSVDIPLVLVGESQGARTGGILDQQMTVLSVEAEATHIPDHIDVDAGLLTEVGSSIHAKDLKLPEGLTLLADPDALIVQILGAISEEQFEAEMAEAAEENMGEKATADAAAEAEAADAEADGGDAAEPASE
jgi:large subunit ribosomal protein L25